MNLTKQNKDLYVKFNRLTAVAFPVILLLLFIIMLWWSWRRWPDILVDFGRELYIPWQISSGKILYKDIAHVFGPLSSYINASLFYLFGASYTVIIIANIVFLAFFLTVLYIFLEKVCSRRTAFLSCGVVISVFSFSQYTCIGNYNFISPYSHEATHGILLSLLMIYQLWRFTTNKCKRNLILAGSIFGLIFLTKVDILISALMVACFFFILNWLYYKNFQSTSKSAGIFLACSCIPVSFFFVYFASVMPIHNALRAMCGSWIFLMETPGVAKNKFYIQGMGFDHPIKNLLKMIFSSFVIITNVVGISFLCHSFQRHKDNVVFKVCIYMAYLTVIVSLIFVNSYEAVHALPMLSFAAFLFLFYSYCKSLKRDREKACDLIPMLLWSVLSLCLLWKMILFCRLFHYGFYLALPSVVLLICILVSYLPEWFDKKLSGSSIFRMVMSVIIILFPIGYIRTCNKIYDSKTFPVGSGGNRIMTFCPETDPRGPLTARAIEWIHSNLNEKETVVVLPEGVMINYLTRRVNPTPYINITVPEMLIFGEDTMLDAFRKHSPDYFVIVHKDTSEYGVGYFGQDPGYGKRIMHWINEYYSPVCLFGEEPLRGNQFGIKILKRRKG